MTEPSAAPLAGRTAWACSRQIPLRTFLRPESGSAAILLAAIVIALAWAPTRTGRTGTRSTCGRASQPPKPVRAGSGRINGYDYDVIVVGAGSPGASWVLGAERPRSELELTINFLAAVRSTRAALRYLLDRVPATIVTVSSGNALLPDPAVIDYSAAKGALTNFGKSLSKEFGPPGVRVNTVSPDPVETVLRLADHGVAATVARATDSHLDEVATQAITDTSTGRFTHRQKVADLILLLAGDRTGNVTGTDILVDGGLVKTL
jgi:NAD(P)-dependent dehydrogenase (short-subunit alcohol dehydrogenase family)